MKLINAISLGHECGMETIEECYNNVSHASTMLFEYDEIGDQLVELENDIQKLAKEYNESFEGVMKWTIKEWESYEK